MSDGARKTPAVPRPAATILVVRDNPFEVLMVRRAAEATFASALVFPGGLLDAADSSEEWLTHVDGADGLDAEERALRIAACRETYEETSILIASSLPAGAIPTSHGDVSGQSFLDLIKALDIRLNLANMYHFAHWVTPEMAPKRFDTHFMLCVAPEGQEARCDESETVELEWVAPADAVARAEAGERSILFPTLMNLRRLAESSDSASAIAAAKRRPRFTVHPQVERREGGMRVRIPAEAGYGITEHLN